MRQERITAVYATHIVTDRSDINGGVRYLTGRRRFQVGDIVWCHGQYVLGDDEPVSMPPMTVGSDRVVISVDDGIFNIIDAKKNKIIASYSTPAWYEYPDAYNYLFIYKYGGQYAVIAYGNGFINVRIFKYKDITDEYTLVIPSIPTGEGIKCEARYNSEDGDIEIGVLLVKEDPYYCGFVFFKGEEETENISYATILDTFFAEQRTALINQMITAYNSGHRYRWISNEQPSGMYFLGYNSYDMSPNYQIDLWKIEYTFEVDIWNKKCIILAIYTHKTTFTYHSHYGGYDENNQWVEYVDWPIGPCYYDGIAHVYALIKIENNTITIIQRAQEYHRLKHTIQIPSGTYRSYSVFNGSEYQNQDTFAAPPDVVYETIPYTNEHISQTEFNYRIRLTNGYCSYLLSHGEPGYYVAFDFILDFSNHALIELIDNEDFVMDITALGKPVSFKQINHKTLLYAGELLGNAKATYNLNDLGQPMGTTNSTYTLSLIDLESKTVNTLLTWEGVRNINKFFDVIRTIDKCKRMLSN